MWFTSKLVVTAGVALAVGGLGFATAPAVVAQPDPEPEPAPQPKTIIDADGRYAVGVDIVPGTYHSAGPAAQSACYWKRVGEDTMLDNALSNKQQVVLIEPTDTFFVTNDCAPWQLTECPPQCAGNPPAGDVIGDVLGFLVPRIGTAPPTGQP